MPHTLHPEKSRSRNEDSTNLQRKEAATSLPNTEASELRVRSKVTIVDRAGPEIWRASDVLTDRICQSPNPEARFENITETIALKVSTRLKRKFPAIKKVEVEETDDDSEETGEDSEEDPEGLLHGCREEDRDKEHRTG